MCVYIYIYRYREIERDKQTDGRTDGRRERETSQPSVEYYRGISAVTFQPLGKQSVHWPQSLCPHSPKKGGGAQRHGSASQTWEGRKEEIDM